MWPPAGGSSAAAGHRRTASAGRRGGRVPLGAATSSGCRSGAGWLPRGRARAPVASSAPEKSLRVAPCTSLRDPRRARSGQGRVPPHPTPPGSPPCPPRRPRAHHPRLRCPGHRHLRADHHQPRRGVPRLRRRDRRRPGRRRRRPVLARPGRAPPGTRPAPRATSRRPPSRAARSGARPVKLGPLRGLLFSRGGLDPSRAETPTPRPGRDRRRSRPMRPSLTAVATAAESRRTVATVGWPVANGRPSAATQLAAGHAGSGTPGLASVATGRGGHRAWRGRPG